jgi:hypothetical protein
MVPASQKDRPISFLLFDGDTFIDGRDLIIRPEELSRTEPVRASVTQTLGGNWVDDFGAGLSTITISGHTGWRGSVAEDGADQFFQLRKLIVERRQELRNERAKTGNPDDIQLVFADQLNRQSLYVQPTTFQLRRHKTRPLLSQYNINMTVLGDMCLAGVATSQDFIVQAIHNPTRHEQALASLAEVQRKNMESRAELAKSGLSASMVKSSQALLDKSDALLKKVQQYGKQAKGVIDSTLGPLFTTSAMLFEASRNAFQIMAMAGDVAQYGKNVLQRIASNFNDALCNLKNGFRRLFTMPDWSDLFGASTCSSTGGGRPTSPWAVENPFYRVSPATPAGAVVNVSSDTQTKAKAIGGDLLKQPNGDAAMLFINSVAAGVTVAP